MLTQELSQSVERTIITLGIMGFTLVLLLHFGLTTESMSLTLPIITPVMAYWFAGQFQPPQDRRTIHDKKPPEEKQQDANRQPTNP